MTIARNARGMHKDILLYHMTTMEPIVEEELIPRHIKITSARFYAYRPAMGHTTSGYREKILDRVRKRA
jgi:hypothetical protein